MKLFGFCVRCRKIRRITVRGALQFRQPVGVCDACNQPNPEPRKKQ